MRGVWLLLLAPALLTGCASARGDLATLASNSDRVIWEAGQEAARKKQWETAREHFRRVIDGFPQSRLGPDARLALGDSYFDEGGTANYILAVSAYREFLTFYPSHPRSDFAQFRVGESYFRQRNPPDRDQTATQDALVEFQQFLEQHPDSPLADRARERVFESRQALARSEYLVGSFYQRSRRAYRAAIARYEGVINQYPDYLEVDRVLFKLGEALVLSLRPEEAAPHLAQLIEDYPESSLADRARQLLSEIDIPEGAADPEATPEETAPDTPE